MPEPDYLLASLSLAGTLIAMKVSKDALNRLVDQLLKYNQQLNEKHRVH